MSPVEEPVTPKRRVITVLATASSRASAAGCCWQAVAIGAILARVRRPEG